MIKLLIFLLRQNIDKYLYDKILSWINITNNIINNESDIDSICYYIKYNNNDYGGEAYYKAICELLIENNRMDIFIKNNINMSLYDNCFIRYASAYGHLEVVKKLLSDPRVDPSDNNNRAIAAASYCGHLEIVKLLLSDPRVDPSDDNYYAIKWASRNGHLKIVKLLLSDPRVDPLIRMDIYMNK